MNFSFTIVELPQIEIGRTFIDRGYIWVDLFFILSGFIITYTATPAGNALSSDRVRDFYWSRITRIVPLHWFCVAAMIAVQAVPAALATWKGQPLDPHWSLAGLDWTVQELSLLGTWSLSKTQTWNGPSWSISAEMFAYLVFPLLSVLLSRKWGFVAMLGASLTFYLYAALGVGQMEIVLGPLTIARCLAGFMIGMTLCRYRDIWKQMSDRALEACQAVAVVGSVAVLSLSLNDALTIPFFALLVGSTSTDRGLIARLFSSSVMQFLGNISYSVYLVHWVVMMGLAQVWFRIVYKLDVPVALSWSMWVTGFLGLSIGGAVLTYRYVELPTRRHFKRRREAVRSAGLVPA